MGLMSALLHRNKRVIGIDASTNTIAFCVMDKCGPIRWGEITLGTGDIYHRLGMAKIAIDNILDTIDIHDIELCCIESAVKINNIKTTINLSYMYGIIIGTFASLNIPIREVTPLSWQTSIGNPSISGNARKEFALQYPGKSSKYVSGKIREHRKSITMKWAQDTYGIETDSDNVSDAVGIAHWGYFHG